MPEQGGGPIGHRIYNARTPNQVRQILGFTDVTDPVLKSLFDANTVLKADSDNTPVALTMGASTILARLASGSIKAATPAEIRTLLGDIFPDLNTLGPCSADGEVMVGTGAGAMAWESGDTLRTSLGLAIGTDVQADLDVPSQAEAEAGTATTERVWTAQRVAQAIAALATGGTPWQTVCECDLSSDLTGVNPSSGYTILWSAENTDPHGMHSTSSNTSRITVTQALLDEGFTKGKIYGVCVVTSSINEAYLGRFLKNGSVSWIPGGFTTGFGRGTIVYLDPRSGEFDLTLNDYYEFQIFQQPIRALILVRLSLIL